MDTPRVRTSHTYSEVAPNTFQDFDWVREYKPELLEKYGECIILVYEKQVLDSGDTCEEAVEMRNAISRHTFREATPILYFLHPHQPFTFLHVRPDPVEGSQ